MIGLAGTDSAPRRTVLVNAMMANSMPLAALLAVPILSKTNVRSRLNGSLGEKSGKEREKRPGMDLPTRCNAVASAAMLLDRKVYGG